jgi:hypothetical protein
MPVRTAVRASNQRSAHRESHSVKRRSGAVQTAGRPYGEKSGANGRSTRPKPHQSKLGKTRAARRSSEDHLRTTELAETRSALLATRLLTALSRSDEIWWSIRPERRIEQRSAGPVRRILFAWAPRSRAPYRVGRLRTFGRASGSRASPTILLSYNQRRAVLERDGD